MTQSTDAQHLPDTVRTAADALNAWFGDRLAALQHLERTLCAELELNADHTITITDRDRRRLKHHSVAYLAEQRVADGCGLILAHSVLDSPRGQLEWWVREDEARFARYSFGVVPGNDRYYDYEQLDWFTRSVGQEAPAFAGPYIDYLGVETYVVTLTTPARVDGELIGAAGNDIQMTDLENEVLPLIRDCSHTLALVNAQGNVIVSNSTDFLVGDIIQNEQPGLQRTVIAPEVFELSLVFSTRG